MSKIEQEELMLKEQLGGMPMEYEKELRSEGAIEYHISAPNVYPGKDVNNGYTVILYEGGLISGVSINKGGKVVFEPGGLGKNLSLTSGAVFSVIGPDGDFSFTHVGDETATIAGVSGGQITGSAVNVCFTSGTMLLGSGASITNTTVNSGCTLRMGGDFAQHTVVKSGGSVFVSNGAQVENTNLEAGGLMVVSGGEIFQGNIGGVFRIENGGSGEDICVGGSGKITVYTGGVLSNVEVGTSRDYISGTTDVIGGGSVTVVSGGSVSEMYMGSGAEATINKSASAVGVTVADGASFYVDGGSVSSVTVNAGGVLYIAPRFGEHASIGSGCADVVSVASGAIVSIGKGANITNLEIASGGILDMEVALGTTVQGKYAGSDFSMENGNLSGYIAENRTLGVNGGFTQNVTVQNAGTVLVFSKGVASDTKISAGGKLQILDGTALKATITSGGVVEVVNRTASDIGIAKDVTVNEGGVLNVGSAEVTYGNLGMSGAVLSGGLAVNTIVNGGTANVLASGRIESTVVESGELNVSAAGTADNTTIKSAGSANVLSGGAAVGNMVEGTLNVIGGTAGSNTVSGTLNVSDGGSVKDTTVTTGGIANVSNGGTADNNIVDGTLNVIGGTADSNTVSGELNVSEGGSIKDTAVNVGGVVNVSAGGAADNNTVAGTLNVQGDANNSGTASNNTVSGELNVSAGGVVKDITVTTGGTANVLNSGLAENNTVDGMLNVIGGTASSNTVAGKVNVSAGGLLEDTTVLSGGAIDVADGGSAVLNTVNFGAGMSVASGGVAKQNTVDGTMQVAGGTAEVTVVGKDAVVDVTAGGSATGNTVSGVMNVTDNGVTEGTWVVAQGVLNVSSKGHALSNTVDKGGVLNISNGGIAEGGDIKGELNLDGGVASNLVVSSVVNVSAGGLVSEGRIAAGGVANVIAGGIIDSAVIAGVLEVLSGGSAKNNEVVSGGVANVSSGGIADGNKVGSAGIMYVSSGGIASNTDVAAAGVVYVHSGADFTAADIAGRLEVEAAGTVDQVNVLSGGLANIQSDGKANSNTVAGSMNLYGTASDTTVSSGGQMDVFAGAAEVNTVAGQLVVSGGKITSTTVEQSGQVVLKTKGSASINTVKGNFDIEVGGSATGNTVASGGNFNVSNGGYADSNTVEAGGTLKVAGGLAEDNTVASGGAAEVFSGGVASGNTILTGAVMDVSIDGVAKDNAVAGELNVFNVGKAEVNAVSSGGVVNVYAGGVAQDNVVSSAGLLQMVGGSALNTEVQTGGAVVVSGGEVVSNTVKGEMTVSSGGAAKANTVEANGVLYVESSGIASGNVINSAGNLEVLGGVASANTINDQGIVLVQAGSAVGNTVNAGGELAVISNGVAQYTDILSGGIGNVNGGSAWMTDVQNGGALNVFAGRIDSTTVQVGGLANIAGGSAADNTVYGELQVTDSGYAESTLIVSGGTGRVTGGTMKDVVVSGSGLLEATGGIVQRADIRQDAEFNVKGSGYAEEAIISGVLNVSETGKTAAALVVTGGVANINDGEALDTTVSGTLNVNGGSAVGGTVAAVGVANVTGGAISSAAVSGILNVSAGGSGSDNTVAVGGVANVLSSGSMTGTVVSGMLNVSGGTAEGGLIAAGGWAEISDNGSISGAIVSGNLNVVSGLAEGNTVALGGVVNIQQEGLAVDNLVSGVLNVAGGTAVSGTIAATGEGNVLAGGEFKDAEIAGVLNAVDGTVSGNTVVAGGAINVYNSGTAAANTVAGELNVFAGGAAEDTTVAVGGVLNAATGGTVTGGSVAGTLNVNGGTAANGTIAAGGIGNVFNGGTADDMTVDGTLNAAAGGVITDAAVAATGVLNAAIGGTVQGGTVAGTLNVVGGAAVSGTVAAGGTGNVLSGGTADAMTVSGTLNVLAAGRAEDTVLAAGAVKVGSDGIAVNTTVNGGVLNVSGGLAEQNDIAAGGSALVSDGGVLDNNTIAGVATAVAGGSALNNTIIAGGELQVASAGVAVSNTVAGVLNVSGGLAQYNTVEAGGSAIAAAGGRAEVNTVYGVMSVTDGGAAVENSVYGLLEVQTGGTAEVITVQSAAEMVVAGGQAFDVEVLSGGTAAVSDNGMVQYADVQTGALLTVKASGTVADSEIAGQLVVDGGVAERTNVTYSGSMVISNSGSASEVTLLGALDVVEGTAVSAFIGGSAVVRSAGTMSDVVVWSNGLLNVNGAADTVSVLSGGMVDVSGVGVVSSASVAGAMSVASGGLAEAVEVSAFGSVTLNDGGRGSAVAVLQGGSLLVGSGAQVNVLTVSSGGLAEVAAGGLSVDNVIAGQLLVSGSAAGNTIAAAGVVDVMSGARVSDTDVSGQLNLAAGAAAADTRIAASGSMNVAATATASDNTVAGQLTVAGSLNSTTVASTGTVVLTSGGSAAENTIGGVLEVGVGAEAAGNTVLSGGNFQVAGAAENTVVAAGGVAEITGQAVSNTVAGTVNADNASLQDTSVEQGGEVNLNGGTAEKNQVAGTLNISGGAIVRDNTVAAGGAVNLYAGNAKDNTVSTGGVLNISGSSAQTDNTNIMVGGAVNVFAGHVEGNHIAGTVNVTGGTVADNELVEHGVVNVSEQGRVVETTLASGAELNAFSGGLVSATEIASGAAINTTAGGSAYKVLVNSGAVVDDFTHVGSNAVEIGKLTDGAITGSAAGLEYTGTLNVGNGGELTNTVISSGRMNVGEGGLVTSTMVSSGNSVYIAAGGSAQNMHLQANTVLQLGTAVDEEGNILSAGQAGDLILQSSGIRVNGFTHAGSNRATVGAMSGSYVTGVASGVNYSGVMEIGQGGVFISGVVNNAVMNVYSGGMAGSSAGVSSTFNAGSAIGAGAQVNVLSGGQVYGMTMVNGAMMVSEGGFAADTIISSGASVGVANGGSAFNVLLRQGGSLAGFTQMANNPTSANVGLDVIGSTYINVDGEEAEAGFLQGVMHGIDFTGSMFVGASGVANNTIVRSGAELNLYGNDHNFDAEALEAAFDAEVAEYNTDVVDVTNADIDRQQADLLTAYNTDVVDVANAEIDRQQAALLVDASGNALTYADLSDDKKAEYDRLEAGRLAPVVDFADLTGDYKAEYDRLEASRLSHLVNYADLNGQDWRKYLLFNYHGAAGTPINNIYGAAGYAVASAYFAQLDRGSLIVGQYGVASQTRAGNNGAEQLIVASGGLLLDTLINRTDVTVMAGGYASGMSVSSGDLIIGGVVKDAIWNRGTVVISSGAKVSELEMQSERASVSTSYPVLLIRDGKPTHTMSSIVCGYAEVADLTFDVAQNTEISANWGGQHLEVVSSGAAAVLQPGFQAGRNVVINVYDGGVASGLTTVNDVFVGANGVLKDSFITNEQVLNGVVNAGELVSSFGMGAAYISSGGVACGVTVSKHISLGLVSSSYVNLGNSVEQVTDVYGDVYSANVGSINWGNIESIYNSNFATMTVLSGGSALDTKVREDAILLVENGGVISNTQIIGGTSHYNITEVYTIYSRGTDKVSRFVNITSAVDYDAGAVFVTSGGSAFNTQVGMIENAENLSDIRVDVTDLVDNAGGMWGLLDDAARAEFTASTTERVSSAVLEKTAELVPHAGVLTAAFAELQGVNVVLGSAALANCQTQNLTVGGVITVNVSITADNLSQDIIDRYAPTQTRTSNTVGSATVTGGTVTDMVVNGGGRANVAGAALTNVEVAAGGRVTVDSNTLLTGKLDFADNAHVTVARGTTINFDLKYAVDASGNIITDKGILTNFAAITCSSPDGLDYNPNYTVTVGQMQQSGDYILAENAGAFNHFITIQAENAEVLGNVSLTAGVVAGSAYSLTLDANDKLILHVCDQVDVVPPAAPSELVASFAMTNAALESGNITVNAELRDGRVYAQAAFAVVPFKAEYSVDGGNSWAEYEFGTEIELAATDTLLFREISEVDGVETAGEEVKFIVPTKNTVVVKATFPEDAVVREYSFDGTNWFTYDPATGVAVTKNGTTVAFRGYDAFGNKSADTDYTVNNIDDIKPDKPGSEAEIVIGLAGSVKVTAVYGAECVQKLYSLDGGASWLEYDETAGVVLNAAADGEVWNLSLADGSLQTGSLNVLFKGKDSLDNDVDVADIKVPTKNDVKVTCIFSSDSVKAEYSLDNGVTWLTYNADTSLPMTDNGKVLFRSFDQVGNMSDVVEYVVDYIDRSAPEAPTCTVSTTEPTNGSVTVTASFSADSRRCEYSLDGVEWFAYPEAGVEMLENGQVYFRSFDELGNVSTVVSSDVTNIDKIAPEAPGSLTASTEVLTNGSVAVSAVFSSDSVSCEYKLNDGEWQSYDPAVGAVLESNGIVYFRGTDAAGNVSEVVSYEVTNIDKIAPAAPLAVADITALTHNNVTVKAVFSEDSVSCEYSLDGTTWVAYTGTGIVMTDNGSVFFRSTDAAGNVSDTTEYIVSNIDWVAPEAPTVAADTALTNDRVVVTAEFSADTIQKEYSLDGSNWRAYLDGVVVRNNNTVVYFRGIDAAGNISEVVSYEVTNIDKIAPAAPTASADVTALTNGNVTVTAEFSADSVTNEYKLNNGQWQVYTGSIELSDNGTVYFRSTDAAGNVSGITEYTVSNIDQTAPNAPLAVADVTALTNGNVNVTAAFSQDSVVCEYKLNDGEWQVYTGSIELTANGIVYFRGTDAAGNVSAVSSYEVANIDKTAPDAPQNVTADVTGSTSGTVTVSAEFSSDSVRCEYSLDGSNWRTYVDGVVMTDNGTVYFRGIDAAGNVSAVSSYEVANIDQTAPAAPTPSADVTDLTNGNVTVKAEFSADSVKCEYSLDGATWQEYTDTVGVVMESNGKIYFRSTNALGIMSAVSSYEVTNIDKVAPQAPTASADKITATNENVTVSAEFSADSVKREYSLDGATWQEYTGGIVMESNGDIFFRGTDAAGNVSDLCWYKVDNIDQTAPAAPTVQSSTDDPTNSNVVVSAVFSSDCVKREYSLDDGATWQDYTTGIDFAENGKVCFRGTDAAGNVSEVVSYEVTNIDKDAPTAPTAAADTVVATSGAVTVSAEFSADSVKREYSLDNKVWYTYTEGVVMTANGTVYFRGYDAAGNMSAISEYTVSNIVVPEVQQSGTFVADLTGDGKDMLVAVNNGNAIIYNAEGQPWSTLGIEAGWNIFGVADVNGDGKDDLLRKHVSGLVVAESSNGDGNFTAGVLNLLDPNWQISGTGDFNGDGCGDVLLTYPEASENVGLLGYWASGSVWTLIDGYSPEWQLMAIGDFNGDGKSDMLWRNSFTGDDNQTYNGYCSWTMAENAGEPNGWQIVSSVLESGDGAWDFLGAGDFDGDGTDDMAMINAAGAVAVGKIENGTMTDWTLADIIDTSVYTFVSIGDFNGDGIDEIAWSDVNGSVSYFLKDDQQNIKQVTVGVIA